MNLFPQAFAALATAFSSKQYTDKMAEVEAKMDKLYLELNILESKLDAAIAALSRSSKR